MDKRLADLLSSSELLTRAEVQRKILKSKALKSSVIAQLFQEGTDEAKLADVFCEYLGAKRVDESNFEMNSTALQFLSKKMAEKNGVLPFQLSQNADRLSVAIFDPESTEEVVQILKTASGNQPLIYVARKSWLIKAIRHYYFGEEWADKPTPKAQSIPRQPKREKAAILSPPNTNTIAKLQPKRRTVLTPIEMDIPKGEMYSESEAKILDEISFGENWEEQARPKRKSKPTPEPTPEPKRQKKKKKVEKKQTSVDQALNDFDSFLENQNGTPKVTSIDPNVSDVPGWTSPPANQGNSSFFGSWDEEAPDKSGGFDLFSEADDSNDDINEFIESQSKKIAKLERDLDRQQSIIQSLIDILSEKKVVSKRDIKKRMDQ